MDTFDRTEADLEETAAIIREIFLEENPVTQIFQFVNGCSYWPASCLACRRQILVVGGSALSDGLRGDPDGGPDFWCEHNCLVAAAIDLPPGLVDSLGYTED